MKINSFFMGASLCALLLSAVGCSNDNDLSDNGMVKITATAGIKNIGDTENPQRVSLGGDYGLVPLWEKDEQIAVKVDGGTVNTLTLTGGENTPSGTFNGAVPASGTKMTAYYPVSAATATDLTLQTGTAEAAAKASVMYASTAYSISPGFSFANKTSILKFNMTVPNEFNTSGTLTATVIGAYSKGTLGNDGSWTSTETAPIEVSGITVSGSKINGYVVVIPGSNVNALSIVVNDGTNSYETAAYTSTTATIDANKIITIGRTLTKNSCQFVNLGLPSGTLWATTNIGANTPEGYGYYYAWGETVNKTNDFTQADYTITEYSGTDTRTVLATSDDAATRLWGSKWRMPTRGDFQELLDKTTPEETTINSIRGCKYTSTVPGYENKFIFFPAAGYYNGSELTEKGTNGRYWSSVRNDDSDSEGKAFFLYFTHGNVELSEVENNYRWYGLPIRPVRPN